MNVLLLFTDLENTVGGIPHYNRLLTRALRGSGGARRNQLTVLALHDAASAHGSGDASYVSRGFDGRRLAFVQAALRAGRQADLVVFGHAHFAPLAWMMPKPRKCLVAHGIEVWDRLSPWRTAGVRRMQEIWTVSTFTRDRMAQWSGIPQDKFRLLPNTLSPELEFAAPDRASLHLPSRPILLSVSRLDARERYKNVEVLLKTVAHLPEVFLVVVGEGTDRARLMAEAEKNGITSRVRFTGAISDEALRGYYEACDVFALPSTGEGFGIVFLEAMARGKPCVGARAGGIPDVIEDQVTGRLVDPARPEELREALRDLFANPKERRRLGSAGRARFENKFAFPQFCRRVAALLGPVSTSMDPSATERLCA